MQSYSQMRTGTVRKSQTLQQISLEVLKSQQSKQDFHGGKSFSVKTKLADVCHL